MSQDLVRERRMTVEEFKPGNRVTGVSTPEGRLWSGIFVRHSWVLRGESLIHTALGPVFVLTKTLKREGD